MRRTSLALHCPGHSGRVAARSDREWPAGGGVLDADGQGVWLGQGDAQPCGYQLPAGVREDCRDRDEDHADVDAERRLCVLEVDRLLCGDQQDLRGADDCEQERLRLVRRRDAPAPAPAAQAATSSPARGRPRLPRHLPRSP